MVHVLNIVGERCMGKSPVLFIPWLGVIEKHVNRLVDQLQKYGLFSDFQYGFRSSRSTADLLIVVSDTFVRAFNKSGATRAVALDISKACDRI